MFAGGLRAADVRYPGPQPCDTSLQDCIDAAAAGDRIELDTTDPIDEDLLIGRSLSIVPAPGRTPLIGGGAVVRSLIIVAGSQDAGDSTDDEPISVTLSNLVLSNVQLAIALLGGSGHDIEVDHCKLTHALNSVDVAGVDVEVRTPGSVLLRDNAVTTTGTAIRVLMALAEGEEAHVTLLGNRLTTSNTLFSKTGIGIVHRGAGRSITDVYSNVIHDIAGCSSSCLSPAGIDISALEKTDSLVDLNNNTIDNSRSIQVRDPATTSTAVINVFNNVVSNAPTPVHFPNRFVNLSIANDFNDFYRPDREPGEFKGYPAGPNTYNVAPGYKARGDYHLGANSSLINLGGLNPAGGLPAEDADGNPRIANLLPDIGAYEANSSGSVGSTTTTSTVTTRTTIRHTTTTIAGSCADVPTFGSVGCRLRTLTDVVVDEFPPGPTRDRALAALSDALSAIQGAKGLVTPNGSSGARASLGRARHALAAFGACVRSHALRTLPLSQRLDLRARVKALMRHVNVLRRTIR